MNKGQEQPGSISSQIDYPWHTLSGEEVTGHLTVTRDQGLSEKEAERRQETYGKNELQEAPPTSIWAMIYDQFANFLVILLLAAAGISAVLGEWVEAAAIMIIVVLNAVLGVVQERRAEEALAALKKMASPDANVLREGHRKSIPSREVVPGDIVFLEAGNFIPADLRLLETVNLRIDEAALTGESFAVTKNAELETNGSTCKKHYRDAIDAIDAEIGREYSPDKAEQYKQQLLLLTRELRRC